MSSEFKHIVRIAGKDVDGTKKLVAALADLKGVGMNLAYAVANALNLDPKVRLGHLSDEDIERIEKCIREPQRFGIPYWMLNRRKDLESGSDLHLVGSDLEFVIKSDIDRERMIGSWRGVRHALGLKVRGQRTRTTGRKGRTVGVRKGGKK